MEKLSMNVGVVGQGFVGTAVYEGLKKHHKLLCYDKDDKVNVKRLGVANLELLAEYSEIIFVCVPTPMTQDGECYTGYVEEVVKELDGYTKDKIVVIKSTIIPGTTARLNTKYKNNTIVFSPEFLTEANSINDFKNQTRIILGGDRKGTNKLRVMFSKAFPKAHIIKTDSTYAEMIKYLTNNFLTVKVAFANEMYKICERLRIDYDKVVEYATLDERLGPSHWGVPGPDGDFGYGGHCFPKDIQAMISLTDELQTPNHVLRGAEDTNTELRQDKDWMKMQGRAVIDEVKQ
jgi:UDPglucose 6-dehydrogenase